MGLSFDETAIFEIEKDNPQPTPMKIRIEVK